MISLGCQVSIEVLGHWARPWSFKHGKTEAWKGVQTDLNETYPQSPSTVQIIGLCPYDLQTTLWRNGIVFALPHRF